MMDLNYVEVSWFGTASIANIEESKRSLAMNGCTVHRTTFSYNLEGSGL